jgi:hypothetical protein
VIGATAFPIHGYARSTLDVDIFIAAERDNAERTLKALREVGCDMLDLSADDLLTKKVLIRQYLLETDVHPFVAGIGFDAVWEHRVASQIGSTSAWFASLDDVIVMKEAAGRPKDLEDLRALRLLRDG